MHRVSDNGHVFEMQNKRLYKHTPQSSGKISVDTININDKKEKRDSRWVFVSSMKEGIV